ncbi:MAG: site-2 protease family protein [Gammaproteobacteria bacterium]|nr:site-2 protease family protein [Gammaproteobacteria bacterium]
MAKEKKGITGFRQFRLFSLFGFEVKLDLSWLMLALLISWSLGAGMFPVEYPGLSTRAYAWMGIASAIGVFFSIVFHEFSHSMVARQFGMPIKGITLFIFGGVAEMEEEPPSPKSEFLMAIAGPLASFLLAFIFSRIEAIGVLRGWPTPVIGVSGAMAYINTVVAVFNLVPAFPLDGGRMLRAALWHWRKDMRAATRISSQMGSGFGLALMILGVISFLQGNIIGGMWWFLIGIFLRGAAAASYQRLVLHDMLHQRPISEFMTRDPVTVPSSLTIRELVENYVYQYHLKMFPVVDDEELHGCVSVDNVKQVPREQWDARNVRDIMEPSSDANTVRADTGTEKLLTAMVRPGRQARYMVVDGRKLVGVISLKDVLEVVALKMEIEPPEGGT